uniref:WRKY domain-containing protein n=1 Tax=Arcella intermedia TaxID=1963864 RepID=A0A6B2LDH5_9EUKA
MRQVVMGDHSQEEKEAPEKRKSTQPRRLEVECSDQIDIMNDGYKWRKYGQKQVKGSTFPRSYYKCVSGSNCNVKKMIERTENETTINIYEGMHNHPLELEEPCKRTKSSPSRGTCGSKPDCIASQPTTPLTSQKSLFSGNGTGAVGAVAYSHNLQTFQQQLSQFPTQLNSSVQTSHLSHLVQPDISIQQLQNPYQLQSQIPSTLPPHFQVPPSTQSFTPVSSIGFPPYPTLTDQNSPYFQQPFNYYMNYNYFK